MSAILDTLREFAKHDHDAFYFVTDPPKEQKKNGKSIHFEGFKYNDPGKYEIHDLGQMYHVILFREDKEGLTVDLDLFEGILLDPYYYVSKLIPNGWYGIIAKKSTTSHEFVDEAYGALKKTELPE